MLSRLRFVDPVGILRSGDSGVTLSEGKVGNGDRIGEGEGGPSDSELEEYASNPSKTESSTLLLCFFMLRRETDLVTSSIAWVDCWMGVPGASRIGDEKSKVNVFSTFQMQTADAS